MFFIKLYGPFVVAVVLLLAAFKIKLKETILFTLKPPFLEIAIPISSRIACRAILILLSLFSLNYYFLIDFSSLFPERFKMTVFYDDEGLRHSLSFFSKEELKKMGYAPINYDLSRIYYEALDKKIKGILNYKEFFSLKQGIVHSEGEVFFKVEKVSGVHNYCITESKGELIHILERPNAKSISFKSFFEKSASSHDYLNYPLTEVLKGEVVLQPRFKQIIAENYRSDGVLFDHTLVSAIKISFFPLPKIENTVYFFELEGKGLIPVAYAIYKY